MNTKKLYLKLRILSLVMLVFVPISIYALTAHSNDEENSSIILLLKNGKKISFSLSEKPVLTTGEQLNISSTKETVTYDYNSICYLYWENSSLTGIKDKFSGDKSTIKFNISNNRINIYGLNKGENVDVYKVNGTVCSSVVSNGGDYTQIMLPSDKGIYIIRTSSGISYKLIKK